MPSECLVSTSFSFGKDVDARDTPGHDRARAEGLTHPYLAGYTSINNRRVIDDDDACARPAVQDARRSDPARDLRAAVPRGREDGRGAHGARRGVATGGLEASRRAEAGRAGTRSP